MLKIEIIRGEYYNVLSPDGSHGLAASGDTLEQAVQRTLDSNKRAVEKGYNAEKWLIVQKKWTRTRYRKSGEFVRESTHSEVVAVVNADGTVEYK